MNVDITALMKSERATVGITIVQLKTTSKHLIKGVLIKSLAANTGKIYIGGADVSTGNGYELSAGQSVLWPEADIVNVYAISDTASQGLCFAYC